MLSFVLARIPVILLGLAAAVMVLQCQRASEPNKNIVCILIDQLRKDAADQWAKKISQTAEAGVVFEGMRAVAPWTYPSVISLLSGLYPQQHGADGRSDNVLSTFDPKVPLIQKLLQSKGYRTSAFVTNPFLHTWNAFHKGFDKYDVHFINSQGNRRGFAKHVIIPGQMYANVVNASIVEHFDATPYDRAEFTYIHYMDVHDPWIEAPYEGGYKNAVQYVDERVIEIYRYFMKRYNGALLFLVTSDHGKAFRDDEQVGHGMPWRKDKGSVHDFNLKIPFWIFPSRFIRESRRIFTPCSNIDVIPTLLDWLNISPPYPLPGISLLPSIQDEATLPADRPVYSKATRWGRITSDCIVYEEKKYIRFIDPKTGEVKVRRVFDLERDPRETESLGIDFGKAAPLLEGASGKQGLSFEARYEKLEDIDPELEQRLRALGYLK
jgi:arylsulfatase A-like enzyme